MAIPASERLLLPRVTRNYLLQHPLRANWGGFGAQTQAFSSDCSLGIEIGPGLWYNGHVEGSKWEMSDQENTGAGVEGPRRWTGDRWRY